MNTEKLFAKKSAVVASTLALLCSTAQSEAKQASQDYLMNGRRSLWIGDPPSWKFDRNKSLRHAIQQPSAHTRTETNSGNGDIRREADCSGDTIINKQSALKISAIEGINQTTPAADGEDAAGVDGYTQAMREKIRERWNPPFGTRYDIDVRFHIQPDGCVSNVQVTTPGVPPELAKSLVDAIAYSSPLDPLPDGCDSDGINVDFFFAKEDSPKHRETTPTSGPIYTPLPSTVKGPTNDLPSLPGTHPFSPDDIAGSGRKVAEKLQTYLVQGKMDPAFVQAEQTADVAAGGASGVEQGPHDNCWFECSLAAFARFPRGQQVISNMISSNGDGSYTVLFPGDPDRPVQVTKSDITSMKLKDSSEWARIIEAAEIKLFPLNSRTAVTGSKHIPAITRGLNLVTGSKTAYLNFDNCGKEDILNFLEHGSDGAHVMVATSQQAPSPDRQYVIPDHGFSVIQYNAQDQTIILRNPWGHNGHKSEREHWPNLPAPGQESFGVTNLGGGLVKMEVSTFEHLYRNLAIARIR